MCEGQLELCAESVQRACEECAKSVQSACRERAESVQRAYRGRPESMQRVCGEHAEVESTEPMVVSSILALSCYPHSSVSCVLSQM